MKKATSPEADGPVEERELEHKPQTEFDLPLRSQSINARTVADAECFVVSLGRAVNRTSSSSEQNTVHGVRRQVEVAEVWQVVEAHARFDREAIFERVPPREF